MKEIRIISGMVARGIQKYFELRIRHRIFIDPKRIYMNCVQMVASRRVLPGILHIHANITETFDLDAVDFEREIRGGNLYHPFECF